MKFINVEINGNFSSLSFDFKHEFDSGITTLLGHIGSGKSTIVDTISGFNRELKSLVNINGNIFGSHLPSKTNLRPISVMFQDTRLIPHMNVKENILFALKKSKTDVVYISLINSLHYYWAKKALNKNYHVIVDKPISENYSQAKNLIKIANEIKGSPDLNDQQKTILVSYIDRTSKLIPFFISVFLFCWYKLLIVA